MGAPVSFLAAFAAAISAARSCASASRPARSAARSKYLRPSIHVCSHTEYGDSGSPLQSAKSASFPGSSEPTYWSIFSDLAGFSVTIFNASSRGTPPYLMALAASVFSRRASSSSSELKPTFTPRSHIR